MTKKSLSDREFTDDVDHVKEDIGSKQLEPVRKQIKLPYSITYMIGYIEPEEAEIQLEFTPTPSIEVIKDAIIKKLPHLTKMRHRITIMRSNPIRVEDYGTK